MAKKDAASKRLAKEIALAELLKKVPPLFPLEELPAPPVPEELPALLWLGDPWPASLGSYGRLGDPPAPLGSYGRGASERPILDAFKAFGLDHRSLSDWRALVFHLAHALFPTPRPLGAPREWTDERLCQLLADVATYKRKKPEASDVAICNWLSKKWSKTPETLRRILQNARNPKHNTELARVVSIVQRRDLLALDRTVEEGEVGTQAYDDDVRAKIVSWVIAHADELWAS
jgi:hypothetical protein